MFNRIGLVFMLHRTAHYDKGGILHNENLKIDPEELDRIINRFRAKGYSFIGIEELGQLLSRKRRPKGKVIVFTLDDGYKDNIEWGYPVFKANDVPFCIYVTNSFPDSTTNLWWFAMESLVLGNDELLMPDGASLQNRSSSDKAKNFLKIRNLVLQEYFRNPLELFQSMGTLAFDLEKEREDKCLSWQQLRSLSTDPLATIGCHTINHLPLSKLSDSEVEFEIATSKDDLTSKLNIPVRHFAFPFGSRSEAGDREYRIAGSVGFETITTTMHGYISLGDDPKCLRRIFLTPDPADVSLLKRQLFWRIKSLAQPVKSLLTKHAHRPD